MKKEKLMIGDLVSVLGTPMRIAELGTVRAGFLDENGEMFYNGYDIIEPIPLTTELLAMNNFKNRGDNHLTYDYGYCYYIEVINCYCGSDDEVTVNLKAGDYRDFMTELRIKVRYVHELQHALRLCEMRKEIEI